MLCKVIQCSLKISNNKIYYSQPDIIITHKRLYYCDIFSWVSCYKIPDSYHYRRRVHLYDTAARAQSETRCVDTSDLGANEEDWFCDEAAATVLGYAEQEVMGHKVRWIFFFSFDNFINTSAWLDERDMVSISNFKETQRTLKVLESSLSKRSLL